MKLIKKRKLIILLFFLALPITINYFSPVLVVLGGFKKVEFLYNTENIVSTDSVSALIRYYMICGGIFLIALIFGKRGACHYICPMAMINILGTKIKNLFRIHSLHIKVKSENCKACNQCNEVCPMSLDVSRMVKEKNMNNTECILCGECSKTCKNGCIEYGFGRLRNKK